MNELKKNNFLKQIDINKAQSVLPLAAYLFMLMISISFMEKGLLLVLESGVIPRPIIEAVLGTFVFITGAFVIIRCFRAIDWHIKELAKRNTVE